MKALTVQETLQVLAKALNRPCIYIGGWNNFIEEEGIERRHTNRANFVENVLKAVPYLNLEDHGQLLADGEGIIICDTYEEMQQIYNSTVGDDGPTETNSYDGYVRVYALTCNAEGILENENT